MKVIDLLNKIANDEETPKEIIYKGIKFHTRKSVENLTYYTTGRDNPLLQHYITTVGDLIEEVEIIEEDKKIEYIHYHNADNEMEYNGRMYKMRVIDKALIEKIDELIKAVNEMRKNER